MSPPPKRPSALPDHLVAEVIGGEVVVRPRPEIPHVLACSAVLHQIGYAFHRQSGGALPGGWWVLVEPELWLGEDVLIPDIAAWKRESLPTLSRGESLSSAPDWVCEVLTPSTTRRDKKEKASSCHRVGVQWRWLVDPEAKTVEAYRRHAEYWTLIGTWGDCEKARIEPFEAIELELERWWEGLGA